MNKNAGRKKSLTITTIFLVAVLSITQLYAIGAVQAFNAVTIYCPNKWVDGIDYSNEREYSSAICNAISNLFYWYGNNYAIRITRHNTDVTASAYSNDAQYAQTYAYQVAVFSKGHCTPWDPGQYHRQLLVIDGNNARDSQHIYPYTSQGKHRFVFLWHCGTAMSYPSQYDQYGWQGMPYCWTRNNNMAIQGYTSGSGSHVFIGFHYWSHQFLDPTNYGGFNYGDYCWYIFWNLLYYDLPVSAALDLAAQQAFGQPSHTSTPMWYGETLGPPGQQFWSCMRVLGNGQGLGVPT